MMIATSYDITVHPSQQLVENAANEQIFEALGIKEKIEALATKHAEDVLPYSGDMETAKKQAREWVVRSLVDYISAEARFDVILVK